MLDDPEYQRFVIGQLKYCHCAPGFAPCDGVLVGGMCDDFQDEEREYDENCWYWDDE